MCVCVLGPGGGRGKEDKEGGAWLALAAVVNVSTVFAATRFPAVKEKTKNKKSERQRRHETQPIRADRREWEVGGGAKPKGQNLSSARSKVRKCSSLPLAFKGGGLDKVQEEVYTRYEGGLEEDSGGLEEVWEEE